MDVQKVLQESQSSVKLTRTTKGYTWEIKVYHEDEKIALTRIHEADTELRERYAPDLEAE